MVMEVIKTTNRGEKKKPLVLFAMKSGLVGGRKIEHFGSNLAFSIRSLFHPNH